jgi:hypothetical protein
MRDPYKKKLRDLRRIARSGGYSSIFRLFDKYHPEIAELDNSPCSSQEWQAYSDLKYGWAQRMAGYWDALGGAPPASFRRMLNRELRTKQKAAFYKAVKNEEWDIFIPPHRRTCRWLWF